MATSVRIQIFVLKVPVLERPWFVMMGMIAPMTNAMARPVLASVSATKTLVMMGTYVLKMMPA